MESGYYEHKLIKPNSIELRDYQVNLANEAKNENSLVVLPTGLGKTTNGLQIMGHIFSQNKDLSPNGNNIERKDISIGRKVISVQRKDIFPVLL